MRFISTIVLVFFSGLLLAQAQQGTQAVQIALEHVQDQSEAWGLSARDLQELSITDHYTTQKTGTQHIYIQQYFQGIPVYNAIQTITISKNQQARSIGQPRLIPDLENRIANRTARLTPHDAIHLLLDELNIKTEQAPQLIREKNKTEFQFTKGDVADQEIQVRKVYAAITGGDYTLAYQVQLDELHSNDWWNVSIDAQDGRILAWDNFTSYCQFGDKAFHNHDAACDVQLKPKTKAVESAATMAKGNYLVIPFPYESPNHSEFSLEVQPADLEASPFGWHDTNGIAGPENTITRGNNVHSFQDRFGSNQPIGDEPEGGAELIFDYPFVESDNPASYSDAAVVNLFYWVNIIHDFSYRYGFDEAAGNFQAFNYNGAGVDGDAIIANAQDGFFAGAFNNAAYSGMADGSTSRISMSLWESSRIFAVTEPASVAGAYNARGAEFGPPIPTTPIVAEVVEYSDGLYMPFISDACEPAINSDELMGKIALIDRGGCLFEQKTINAEAAGAIAVIICNYESTPANMAGNPTLDDPGIPTLSIGATECATIRTYAGTGLTVSFGQQPNSGPLYLDSDFDNGIIAHEAAHGISERITGGPSTGACLNNLEQMGEGWSDFFALIMTTDSSAHGAQKRGAGTYVQQQDIDGKGIRRYPYTTDMSINPLTYIDVSANPEIHALGEVWTSVLWDLYWALVEKYDFDNDLVLGDGGNNIAIQLVMDGMKLQPCQPGFVDGRDAILLADSLLTGGENECLIWEVFARRGIGFYADQGSSHSGTDQVADFEPKPFCVEELKMKKTVSSIVDAGDDILVTIDIVNHDPITHTEIIIEDIIPDDLSYVNGSANYQATVNANHITFEIGDLSLNEQVTLQYKIATDPSKFSTRLFLDDMENGTGHWLFQPVEGSNHWASSEAMYYAGNTSLAVNALASESQQIVFTNSASQIVGENPVLRFYHSYHTEPGQDGGAVQVTDNLSEGNWENLDDKSWRGKYNGPIDYQTFVIPNFQVFSGNSDGYISSYFSLSDYIDKALHFRFNFATSEGNGVTAPNEGFWSIDNFELLDLLAYNWETCMNSNEGPTVCQSAPEGGTVIETNMLLPTSELAATLQMQIYPNPAKDFFTIALQSQTVTDVTWSLQTVDGRIIQQKNITTTGGQQQIAVATNGMVPGLYFLQLSTPQGILSEKIILQ